MLTRCMPVAFAAGALVIVGALCHVTGNTVPDESALRGRQPARVRSCGTSELTDRELDAVDRLTANILKRRGLTRDLVPTGEVNLGTIYVAVHVIYYTDGQVEVGRLTMSEINDQIDVLNDAYDNLTFELDSVDFTDNQAWFNMTPGSNAEYQAKSTLQADPYEFLNLYTTSGGGLLGWATFPWSLDANPELDGVVVAYDSFPGGSPPYDEGDTATHEVGHWCGLYHTFQGACRPPNDRVSDTPAERSPTYGCPAQRNSCPIQPGNDPIENFMDYTDDPCMYLFTSGQYDRIAEQMTTYRSDVLN